MLVNVNQLFQPEGHQEPCNKVGSLGLTSTQWGWNWEPSDPNPNALTRYILNTLFRIFGLLCIFFEWKGSISLPKSSIVDDIYPLKLNRHMKLLYKFWIV